MPKPTERSASFKYGYRTATRDCADICEAVASEAHASSDAALRIARVRIRKLRPRSPVSGAPAPKEQVDE